MLRSLGSFDMDSAAVDESTNAVVVDYYIQLHYPIASLRCYLIDFSVVVAPKKPNKTIYEYRPYIIIYLYYLYRLFININNMISVEI
jgi:hypothetical protein